MRPFWYLYEWCVWATQLLIAWAIWLLGAGWPLNLLVSLVNQLSDWTAALAVAFFDLSAQWDVMWERLDFFQGWTPVLSALKFYWDRIMTAANWVKNAVAEIGKILDPLWAAFKLEVQKLIDAATAGLAGLLKAWEDFKTYTLPKLLTSLDLVEWWKTKVAEVQKLIETAVLPFKGILDDWNKIGAEVVKFIYDPLEWLWGKFTDWFLGPEGR